MDLPIRRAARMKRRTATVIVLLTGAYLLATVGYELATSPARRAEAISHPNAGPPRDGPLPIVPAGPSLKYLELVPRSYAADSTKRWPLILYLHGSGWRGDDVGSLRRIGFLRMVAQDDDFPFFVVAPQCPRGRDWRGLLDALNRVLDVAVNRHRIDPDRLYCTGESMGGYGTWAYAAAYPRRFAGVVPVCGGGQIDAMVRIGRLPIWVFHGANDQIVPIARSAELVAELRRRGSDVKFTIYPLAGHDVGAKTYGNPELYAWLLSHKRTPPSATP